LKVGIYQNPPLIGLDSADGPGGFMVKLLDEIAKENNWQLEYQQYDFAACLKALQSGEIDIMPALAYSQHRGTLFYLNEVNVVVNWASLYKHEDDNSQYNSVEALRNQRVGVLADDYFGQNGENGLLDLLDELDIITNIKYFNSYQEVVSAIKAEENDLGLLSRYYGELQTVEKDVVKAPVNVAYVSLRYGFHRSEENNIRLAEFLG